MPLIMALMIRRAMLILIFLHAFRHALIIAILRFFFFLLPLRATLMVSCFSLTDFFCRLPDFASAPVFDLRFATLMLLPMMLYAAC